MEVTYNGSYVVYMNIFIQKLSSNDHKNCLENRSRNESGEDETAVL